MFATPFWKLTRTFVAIVLTVATASCARLGWFAEEPQPESEVDPDRLFNLQIEIGRLEVLQDRAWEAAELIAARTGSPIERVDQNAECEGCEVGTPRALHADLKSAVIDYQSFQAEACTLDLESRQGCDRLFEPKWAAQSADEEPTLNELQIWYEAVLAELSPLWGEVCTQAVAISGNDLFCSVE